MAISTLIGIGVLFAFVGFVGAGAYLLFARFLRFFALPSERSMHSTPTPTGAGWVLVVAAITIYAYVNWPLQSQDMLLPALLLLLAIVSWYDDGYTLPTWIRFAVHCLAVAVGLWSLGAGQPVLSASLPLWLDYLIVAIAWLWFINLFNFMDGVDGIACVEISSICAGIIIVGLIAGIDIEPILLALAVGAASLGILYWNWHPAKVYLGDTGSISMGFLLGWLLLKLVLAGYIIAAFLLPVYFVSDATITLVRRMILREPFWRAHRSHYYQLATVSMGSPVLVVRAVIIGNGALILAAIWSMQHKYLGLAFGGCIMLLLLYYLHYRR